MDKTIFYAPDIQSNNTLPPDESAHCIRVLRKKIADQILITDGQGHYFEAQINSDKPQGCTVDIIKTISQIKQWDFTLQIAFAPTKNIDRIEWFVEKATEIGIDRLTPLRCRYSERKEIKTERIQKILVSAMKQSQKAYLPLLDQMLTFAEFIQKPFDGQKFIAHCYPTDKKILKRCYQPSSNALVLIGPEGDFSEQEVEDAIAAGYQPISLGQSRLRSETAALVACHTIQIMNQ